jgi:hypothetical protein
MKLNNMNKKYTKIQQQLSVCMVKAIQQQRNGFYTKIIAFVMCNVTNLSTKPSVVKESCQMHRSRGNF